MTPTLTVTDAMIEAGLRAFFIKVGRTANPDTVQQIYLAMHNARTPASPTSDDVVEEYQRQLRLAYIAGATDVHNNWQEDRDPCFAEAAYDYVANLDALAAQPKGEG